nr:hypothetical protein BaRGS_000630 [Batillaria attramentaria]
MSEPREMIVKTLPRTVPPAKSSKENTAAATTSKSDISKLKKKGAGIYGAPQQTEQPPPKEPRPTKQAKRGKTKRQPPPPTPVAPPSDEEDDEDEEEDMDADHDYKDDAHAHDDSSNEDEESEEDADVPPARKRKRQAGAKTMVTADDDSSSSDSLTEDQPTINLAQKKTLEEAGAEETDEAQKMKWYRTGGKKSGCEPPQYNPIPRNYTLFTNTTISIPPQKIRTIDFKYSRTMIPHGYALQLQSTDPSLFVTNPLQHREPPNVKDPIKSIKASLFNANDTPRQAKKGSGIIRATLIRCGLQEDSSSDEDTE